MPFKEEIKTVSVVLCTYNGEKYLEQQLDSILHQTFPILEIIIQDDCSTDHTWEIINKYSRKHPKIIPMQNKINLGAHKNFINAILKCKGEYISPCDQDDIWHKDKIKILINLIEDKLLAHSQSQINFYDGQSVDLFQLRNPYVTLNELIWDNKFPGHAYIFHKRLLPFYKRSQEIINENPEFSQSNAYDHIAPLVALALNSIVITNEKLQIWNRHSNVCNQQFVFSKSISAIPKEENNYKKFIYASIGLIKKKKSNSIYETFYSRYEILRFILMSKKTISIKNLDKLSLICKCVAKQTFISFIKAGILNCIIHFKKSKGLKFRKKIGELSYWFRYPFIYWYDMNKVKYL